MSNARRIILILVLIAIFVIIAQRLDRLTGPPATPSSDVAPQLSEPLPATAAPRGYPVPLVETPEGSYPPPKPKATPTPEGYQPPAG